MTGQWQADRTGRPCWHSGGFPGRCCSPQGLASQPLQDRSAEAATLQRQLRMAEQGIQRAEQQLAANKDRLLSADTDVQSLRKQLAAVKVGARPGSCCRVDGRSRVHAHILLPCLHGLPQPLIMNMYCMQAERDALRRDNESSERGALRSVA